MNENTQPNDEKPADGRPDSNGELATVPIVLGLLSDCRTQRWRITCPKCSKQFEPNTTRLSWQDMQCPKCGAELIADYNAEPPIVKVANDRLEPPANTKRDEGGIT